MIRDYLRDLTQHDDMEAAVDQLERLWSQGTGRSRDAWTREELHERP